MLRWYCGVTINVLWCYYDLLWLCIWFYTLYYAFTMMYVGRYYDFNIMLIWFTMILIKSYTNPLRCWCDVIKVAMILKRLHRNANMSCFVFLYYDLIISLLWCAYEFVTVLVECYDFITNVLRLYKGFTKNWLWFKYDVTRIVLWL